MPLPPPPAGPPPASTRSQSLNRPMESPSSGFAPALPLRSRRPPGNGTALDTVPPTPADWREEDGVQYRATSRDGAQGPARLHIDTGSIVRKRQSGTDLRITTTAATSARDSSAGGLFRSPAVRTRSAKGIRERRSESRNGKGRSWIDSAIEHSNSGAPWAENVEEKRPTDLVLSPSQVNASKQKIISRPTPKSGKSMQSLDSALNSAEMQLQAGKAVSFQSSHSTPQGSSRSQQVPDASMLTPPFSPGNYVPSALESLAPVEASPPLPPKLHEFDSPSKSHEPSEALSVIIPPAHEQRPVSHILHLPNSNDSIQIPLTPLTKAAQESIADLLGPESPKAFATRAMERHRVFAEREAAAASDSERLDLFIHYMAAESRIRREQYSSVFNEEHIDVDELTRGFFGHTETNHKSHERQQIARCEDASKRTSIASSALEDSSSQGDSSAVSRKYESPSSVTTNSSTQHRPESTWWKDYVPCLSPIASMSIVTGQDEMDSRGRAPSRWWEGSHSGDAAQGDAFKVLERSKRESKYMGVPCESRTSPAIYDTGASASQSQTLGSSRQAWYGLKEYPPEKIGWHKTNSSAPPPPPKPPTPLSAQVTPDPRSLDISRLVTLPPPYPRHHPAVNNSHPNLADVRAVVRLLQEKGAEAARDSYRTQILDERKRADSWCKHQRSLHGQDIKFRIERGELSQDQFEDAELELADKLVESEKAVVQADFDLFQNVVLTPLHGLLSDRISLATNSLDKLSSRLFSDAQSRSPNLPQEEGDEQPELLEKLTQLKWLFEARENLHRQIYDLLSERNHRYKEIVLLPYKHSHNRDKHAEAELFFTQDAQERRSAFEQAAYSRAQAFLSVIENNVSRGAEVQLSAFWDIAPSLLELLHKIPDRLEGFSIHIPADEYAENPAYYDHPLQYLYSLLGHTEKSTYQFIESQINLFCLLHEIRSCALVARCRVEELEGDGAERQRAEERKLTDDLKEKVGMVEGQWQEALGAELREVRERVRGALLEAGGWDDEGDDV